MSSLRWRFKFKDGSIAIVAGYNDDQVHSKLQVLASRLETSECREITSVFKSVNDEPWVRVKNIKL